MEIKISAMQGHEQILPFKELHVPGKPSLPYTQGQQEHVKAFNFHIENGVVGFESVPCLCGSCHFTLLASYDRYAMRQSTVICVQCGLIQSNPRMTQKAYADFYSSDTYRRCYDSGNYLNDSEKQYSAQAGQSIFKAIDKIKKISSGISVLEIGAGGGWNLLPFLKAGAESLGYDYSPTLVDLGRRHGIPMRQGSSDDIQGQFDVIILNHVWEHLLDPVASLKKIVKHLKNEGIIYMAVPNVTNGILWQFQNAHTYYFDPQTFHYYASMAGLRLIAFGPAEKIHMFGIFKPGHDPKVPGLKGHYRHVLWILRFIRIKRTVKLFLKSLLKQDLR